MFKYIHFILRTAVVLSLFYATHLQGETAVVETYKKQETELSGKRFGQKKWSGKEPSDLTRKKIQFKHWNKHYSSLGTKKWDHTVEKTSDKKRFKTSMVEFSNQDIQLSEWQGYLADLESRAQISTDSKARIIQNKRIYERMLQQAENYNDTGELLSLREINRFQFRKNRSDNDVPVTKAGAGESE